MIESYFDVDRILSMECTVECMFQNPVFMLGKVFPNAAVGGKQNHPGAPHPLAMATSTRTNAGDEIGTVNKGPVTQVNVGDDLAVSSSRTPAARSVPLVTHSSSSNLPAGTKLQLPLWAASPLRERNFVSLVSVPTLFTAAVFREFKADPLAPDLHRKSPYFYEYGLTLARLMMPSDGTRLRNQLLLLFEHRQARLLEGSMKRDLDLDDLRVTLSVGEQRRLDLLLAFNAQEAKWMKSRT